MPPQRDLPRCPRPLLTWGLLLLACWAGCSEGPDSGSPPPDPNAARSTDHAPVAGARSKRQSWDVIYSQGAKIGYAHTDITRHEGDDGPVRRVQYEYHLQIGRFGDVSAPSVRIVSDETPEGQVLSFQSDVRLSGTPIRAEGRVRNGQMVIETTTAGKTVKTTLPWSDDIRGMNAVEDELAQRPMKPGERRALKVFDPFLTQVLSVQLAAGAWETTPLLDGRSGRLLRIDSTAAAEEVGQIRYTLWVDERGTIRKKRTAAGLVQEEFRTTRQVALAAPEGPLLDLGRATVVRLKRPLERPHETLEVRYRVRLRDDDPRKVFAAGASQQVESVDERTARLTVRAIRPRSAAGPSPVAVPAPTDEDRQPNGLIQSDDPRIVELAGRVAADERDAWRVALALERLVHRTVTEKNYQSALASAAEVAQTLEGDCTEHAVLLAALARARGIPARVAVGLVYSPGVGGFAFHMWNEVYARGGWYPLDATLGRGGIGAAHLKLMDSNLNGTTGMASFLKVAQVMGQLDVQVEQARYANEAGKSK